MRHDRVDTGEAPVSTGPPRLPFVLSVGVTGHRVDGLPEGSLDALRSRIRDVLNLIEDAGAELLDMERDCFAADPTRLRFVSPLADGADQIAAEAALELGWELQAVLPFEREEYRATRQRGARRAFRPAARPRDLRLELPGDTQRELDAYVMAGRATVAHCDILIAVWDGLPARGRGGTGEVVAAGDHARNAGDPHAAGAGASARRMLWSAFDPTVVDSRRDPMAERPLDANVDQMLNGLLCRRPTSRRSASSSASLRERLRRYRARHRISAAAGRGRRSTFRRRDFAKTCATPRSARNGGTIARASPKPHEDQAPIDLLEDAYSWTDRLATHFAQTYRSGHIFNFVLGGFAVCMGLSAFMAPHLSSQFAALEMRDHRRDHPQRPHRHRATNGTAAGSIIASWPSGCGRCAA